MSYICLNPALCFITSCGQPFCFPSMKNDTMCDFRMQHLDHPMTSGVTALYKPTLTRTLINPVTPLGVKMIAYIKSCSIMWKLHLVMRDNCSRYIQNIVCSVTLTTQQIAPRPAMMIAVTIKIPTRLVNRGKYWVAVVCGEGGAGGRLRLRYRFG